MFRSLFIVVLLFTIGMDSGHFLQAQNPVRTSGKEDAGLTIPELQKEIDALQKDETVKEEEKADLVKRFGSALTQLESAINFEREGETLANEAKRAPGETEILKKELEERRADSGDELEKILPTKATPEMIDAKLASEQALVAELGRQLREIESSLSQFESLPVKNRERIAVVTRLLAEEENAGKGSAEVQPSWSQKADEALARTRLRQLRAELAKLEQETLVTDVLRNRDQVRKELVSSDLERAKKRVEEIGKRSGELVAARISEAESLIGKLGDGAAAGVPEVMKLVEETRALARKSQDILSEISEADAELTEANDELQRFRRESEGIRAQVEIGGLEDSFAEIVVDLRRSLPTPQSLRMK